MLSFPFSKGSHRAHASNNLGFTISQLNTSVSKPTLLTTCQKNLVKKTRLFFGAQKFSAKIWLKNFSAYDIVAYVITTKFFFVICAMTVQTTATQIKAIGQYATLYCFRTAKTQAVRILVPVVFILFHNIEQMLLFAEQ